MIPARSRFPDDFLFGAATSSYQIEGHKFGGAGRTHWDDFAETPGNVVRQETGALACDHYRRVDEDLDLLKDLEPVYLKNPDKIRTRDPEGFRAGW